MRGLVVTIRQPRMKGIDRHSRLLAMRLKSTVHVVAINRYSIRVKSGRLILMPVLPSIRVLGSGYGLDFWRDDDARTAEPHRAT